MTYIYLISQLYLKSTIYRVNKNPAQKSMLEYICIGFLTLIANVHVNNMHSMYWDPLTDNSRYTAILGNTVQILQLYG